MAQVQYVDLTFLEQWALTEDRRSVLGSLVPGSDKWYYFIELLSEQEGYPADLEDSIAAFLVSREADRNTPGDAARFKWRRAVKKFGGKEGDAGDALSAEDKATIAKLVSDFRPTLAHRRELPAHADDRVDSTPSVLSTASLTPEARLRSLGSDSTARRQLDGAERAPLEDVGIWTALNGDEKYASLLRWLLAGHGVPRHCTPGERVAAVEMCLKERERDEYVGEDGMSRRLGGGSHHSAAPMAPLFRNLSLAELRSLRERGKVDVSGNEHYLKALLSRLGPGEGVEFDTDLPAAVAYWDAVLAELGALKLPPKFLPLLHAVYFNRVSLAKRMTGRVTGGLPGSAAAAGALGVGAVAARGRSRTTAASLLGMGGAAVPAPPAGGGDFGSEDFYHLVSMPRYSGGWAEPLRRSLEKSFGDHWRDLLVSVGSGAARGHAGWLWKAACPSDASDRALVEEGIAELLGAGGVGTPLPKPFLQFVEEDTLKRWRAQALLLAGKGGQDTSLVTELGGEGAVTALRDRVDLAFAPHNAVVYDVEDAVTLSVYVKGISELTVSVFEINTTAWYQEKGTEISTGIDLDGMLPNDSRTLAVAAPPLERRLHSIPVEALSNPATARRGVYVIELVGGGFSTRALVRKGALRFVSRDTAAGHAFRVLDETNAPVGGSLSLWVAGRSYTPREDGEIVVPFAQADRSGQRVVMTVKQEGAGDDAEAWSFSSLGRFNQHAEHYALAASWYVEEEALVKDNRKATIALRARLRQAAPGQTAPLALPLSLLEDVRVTVESTDGDGVSSSRDFRGVALSEGEETTLTIAVPGNLRRLSLTLRGAVTGAITGTKTQLSAAHTVELNSVDAEQRMKCVFLRYVPGAPGAAAGAGGAAAQGEGKVGDASAAEDGSGGWRLYALGKSGEPLPGVHLYLYLHHPVWEQHSVTLSTNAAGWVSLGELHALGYTGVTVHDQSSIGVSVPTRSFPLTPPGTASAAFHGDLVATEGAGTPLTVPFHAPAGTAGVPAALTRMVRSALPAGTGGGGLPWGYFHPALSAYAPLEDASDALAVDVPGKCVTVAPLPAGVYQLTLFHDAAAPEHVIVTVLDADTAQTVATGAATLGAATGAGGGAGVPAAVRAQPATAVLQTGVAFARRTAAPVRVTDIAVQGEELTVSTAGGAGVRVHVVATHFAPLQGELGGLGQQGVGDDAITGAASEGALKSQYIPARKLGEEQRYILERTKAEVLPGNTLPRPSLLLNPWAVAKTQTDTQDAAAGTAYADVSTSGGGGAGRGGRAGRRAVGGGSWRGYARSGDLTLDFLAHPARTHFNLRPDADGVVRLPLADVATPASGAAFISVLAVDAVSSAHMTTSVLPDGAANGTQGAARAAAAAAAEAAAAWTRPTSLEFPLDPTEHFIQQKSVSVLQPGASAAITATSDSRVEEYPTLGKVAGLFAGLSGNMPAGSGAAAAELGADWGWLATWPSLPPAQQRAKYSKYACHELHLFLAYKDRPFFDAVVAPYLATKRAKTFMDRYLLGEDLAHYATPAGYAALNAAERALLLGRLPGTGHGGAGASDTDRATAVAAAGGAAHPFLLAAGAADAAEAAPTPSTVWELVFRSAISANALEDDEGAHALADKLAEEARKTSLAAGAAAELFMAQDKEAAVHSLEGFLQDECAEDLMGFVGAAMPQAAAAPQLFARAKKTASSARRRAAPQREMLEQRRVYEEEDEECDEDSGSDGDDAWGGGDGLDMSVAADLADRKQVSQQAYRALDKTEEFAETHFWKVHTTRSTKDLVVFSEFWADLAVHRAKHGSPGSPGYAPFVSANFPLAARSLNEMLLALAVLDLPFANSDPSDVSVGGGKLTYTAKEAPLVLFHKDLRSVAAPETTTVLVGQNYFDPADRYKTVKGQRVDKYLVGGEFLRHKVYGVQVVITNVSSASQELDLLLQIPQGAVPLQNGFVMRSFHQRLSAYSTHRQEYLFYFPALGDFVHYPLHVAADEALVAAATPTRVHVVSKPSVVDRESWEYVSQQGSEEEVLAFLRSRSLAGVDVGRVAWRCGEAAVWRRILDTLSARGVFHATLWSYGLKHADVSATRQWLLAQSGGPVRAAAWPTLAGGLVTYAPEPWTGGAAGVADSYLDPHSSQGAYEHLEYSPLVNARAHQLGAERKIMNRQQAAQWRRLLEVLAHQAPGSISLGQRLAVVYHLLLQDRVTAAQKLFAAVPPLPGSVAAGVPGRGAPASPEAEGAWCTLMYDYLAAYLDFFNVQEQPTAVAVAAAYAEYPVPKWQRKFAAIGAQLAEAGVGGAGGGAAADADLHADAADDKELARETQTSALMSKAPSLDVGVEGASIRLAWANLSAASLRFYLMDIELLFSTSAFVTAGGGMGGASTGRAAAGQFAFVRPNAVQRVPLTGGAPVAGGTGPAGEQELTLPVPAEYRSRNVLIEGVAGGIHRTVPYFSNTMRVHVVEDAGRVSVRDSGTGAPLPCVYVKVYSRRSEGDSKGRFYKDGYTDLRGVFDFASLSTDELSHVQRFALLVKSASHGAVIRTARPPSGAGGQ